MNRNTMSFIALAVSILYGVGFIVFHDNRAYAVIGAALVAIGWIAVGFVARANGEGRDRQRDR